MVASGDARCRGLARRVGFNPLHCGAVVASIAALIHAAAVDERVGVSIPFIAGQWSLRLPAAPDGDGGRPVSIPFIAGQWSLHLAAWRGGKEEEWVSIPFIAGQWSLRTSAP